MTEIEKLHVHSHAIINKSIEAHSESPNSCRLNNSGMFIEKLDFLKDNDKMLRYVKNKMMAFGCVDKKLYDSWQTELDYYTEEMKKVGAELAEARSLGYLSENEEYWILKEEKKRLEDCIRILKNNLANAKILTDQEAEELRRQLCEEYVRKEDEIYQRIKKIPVKRIARELVHNSGLKCYGCDNMGEFAVMPSELLEVGSFYVGLRSNFDTLLVHTPKEEWKNRVCQLVDELVYRTAYLHAYYALKEAKEVAKKQEGVWDEELESWLQKMGTGNFYNSTGILVGKSEHRLDGDTTYFTYDKDGNTTKIVDYPSVHEWAEEDVEYEVVSTVDFRGKTVGATYETKKAKAAKEIILKHNKDFGGSLNDIETMKLAGVSRKSFYKYKRELRES